MRIKYYPSRLVKSEQQLLDHVLCDELEVQTWRAVARSNMLQEELTIVLQ